MKRRYTAEEYLEIVGRVRRAVPRISISSDFIVGFPGETDLDFEDTLRLVREVEFGSLFGFRYSPRPGTASARWGRETEVPGEISAGRLARLLELQTAVQGRLNAALVGREFEVLIEGTDRRGQSTGRTPCNRILHLEGAATATPGRYVRARVTRGLANSLIGMLAA
jgi:tRNA-2-methylthio-N6-dimethylallyladenosine synthase